LLPEIIIIFSISHLDPETTPIPTLPPSDPCMYAVTLPSMSQRGIQCSAVEVKDSGLLCDRTLEPTWYKPIDNDMFHDMPTSCVSPYVCGTEEPIWLNGTYFFILTRNIQRSRSNEDQCGTRHTALWSCTHIPNIIDLSRKTKQLWSGQASLRRSGRNNKTKTICFPSFEGET
jgi:hypothetical protein